MTIIEFLEARIAEDERAATYYGSLALGTARVLAECAAKRALVDIHTRCDDVSYGDASTCPEIRLLAAVYRGHPDYHLEWAL